MSILDKFLGTQKSKKDLHLEEIVERQSNTGYVFLDMNEDLAHCEYNWLEAPPDLFMAYGYARRTITSSLLIQGIENKNAYSHTVSLFKSIQLQTDHTVKFQEQAAHAAEIFMATYDVRINKLVIGKIVGLAKAFKPFAALAPMEDRRMFSALVPQVES